jgi:copper chaperone
MSIRTTSVTTTGTTSRTYLVAGMTCAHCVAAVREEIGKLETVQEVDVDLVPGGTSRVTVTSTAAVPDERMWAAVDEAGYELMEDSR